MSTIPIVFIHGLWLHPSSWESWVHYFKEKGYEPIAPPWPGDSITVESTRANATLLANKGIKEIVDSYAKVIADLPVSPIVIGHSFGGLIAQELLAKGLAIAAIAIDPAPIKGVWQLPFSSLKASFPVLDNPFNLTRTVSLTFNEFRYGFANTVSEDEAQELYDSFTIPAPARPLFQAATASFNPNAETKVDVGNTSRGPLLLIAGENDHTAPPAITRATLKLYRSSSVVTDFKEFEGRGHSLVIDHGWRDIADYSLEWLHKQNL